MAIQYHTQVKEGDVAPYVLLPGDPKRVPKIAALWDEARPIADNREHVTYTGVYKGVPITCTSTGMGCPSTAIAMEELARAGGKTFLRMGTCGTIQDYVNIGDILIFDSACRYEGTSYRYVPVEFPAVAHYEVVEAAVETAKRLSFSHHVGTSRTSDAFFANRPGANVSFNGYHQSNWDSFLSDLKMMNVVGAEMEASIVMVLGRIFGLRSGALCVCLANILKKHSEGSEFDNEKDIVHTVDNISKLNLIACETMKTIYEKDQCR